MSESESDHSAHDEPVPLDDAQLLHRVRELLGARLTAYIAGATDTSTVHAWAAGTLTITSSAARSRLQTALRAATLIASRDSNRLSQAWFQGQNPDLDDIPPARLLLEAEDPEAAAAQVLAAARKFAAAG